MLKTAFSDNTMGITQIFEWFSQLKRWETMVKGCEHSGPPSTGHTDEKCGQSL
jgi:hypothetical protein